MSSYKKYLAGIMAATMVAGSSFAAFAADQQGTGQGTGTLDIVENSDVFDVIVPTSGGTTFNYILDPTGVISKTSAEKYNGATFIANKRVYFGQIADIDTASGGVGGTVQQYDDTSDKIVVTNKSSMDVNISVAATVQSPEGAGIKLVDNKTFDASDKNPSVYLALTDGTNTNAIKADNGATLSSTIRATADAYVDAYENGKYVKKLKQDVTSFNTYSFYLTGDCNPNGKWDGVARETPPAVEVTWTVKDPTGASNIFSFTELTADNNEVPVNGVATGATVSRVVIKRKNGTDVDITANTTGGPIVSWLSKTGTNGEMIFKVSATIITNTNNAGSTIEVTYSDGSKGTLSIPE